MIENFISFFSENLLLIQFIILFVSGILVIFCVYYIVRINIFREGLEHFIDVFASRKNIGRRRILRGWSQILKKMKTRKPEYLKSAIFEADRILNEILRMSGYPGKNPDERLELADSNQISNIEELRQAHKFRNRIASEPDLIITLNEAGMIIEIYKKAFQELNLIQ